MRAVALGSTGRLGADGWPGAAGRVGWPEVELVGVVGRSVAAGLGAVPGCPVVARFALVGSVPLPAGAAPVRSPIFGINAVGPSPDQSPWPGAGYAAPLAAGRSWPACPGRGGCGVDLS
ncbi:hypothetical protein [Micromonospora sp. NPDC049374]|uniref:hypothetical protein n=1 Tax=Micromonospora sp. NPDC049374 TaxID=3154352 RepID=UPI00343A862B